MEVIMKHLYLLLMLVITSISFGQVAPGDGAFTTFHVKAENPTEYADFLAENSALLAAQGPQAAGTCITRSGNRYTGEMFVWQAFNRVEEPMENSATFDPFAAPKQLQNMRTPLYSSFWKPLKSFSIRPNSFERVQRVIVEPQNLQKWISGIAKFEKEIQKTNPDFVIGVFQSFGGGAKEAVANQYMIRALADDAGEHGRLIDQFFTGTTSWGAMYQELLSLGTIIDDNFDECQILYASN